MADYTDSKKFGQTSKNGTVTDTKSTNIYPVESFETTNLFGRIESILTPAKLKSRHLKGIDMDDFTSNELKDRINMAMNEVELLTNLNLTRVQHKDRLAFDRSLYRYFVNLKVNHGPILSVEDLSIESSNGESVYRLPPVWIEMGHAHRRTINLIPILNIFGAAGITDGQPSNAGLIFLNAVKNFVTMPAFFTIKYTVGVCHKDGQLPSVLNQIIGMTAAMDILSEKAATFRSTSSSITQDSIAQSASTLGPKQYQQRYDELEKKRERQMQKIRAIFHQKYYLSNI